MKKTLIIIFLFLSLCSYCQKKPHTNYRDKQKYSLKHFDNFWNYKIHYALIFESNKEIVCNEFGQKGTPALDKGFLFVLSNNIISYELSLVWTDYINQKLAPSPQINLSLIFKI